MAFREDLAVKRIEITEDKTYYKHGLYRELAYEVKRTDEEIFLQGFSYRGVAYSCISLPFHMFERWEPISYDDMMLLMLSEAADDSR